MSSPRLRRLIVGAAVCLAHHVYAQVTITNQIPGAFTDISQTGTLLILGDDDEISFITTISNAVFPAGEVRVGNNGGAAFSPVLGPDLSPLIAPLPSFGAFAFSKALLPFWADIGNTTGTVHFEEINNVLIVQWTNKKSKSSGLTGTFQFKVFGGVRDCVYAQMIYQDIQDPGWQGGQQASIGYQQDETIAVQWSFNQAFAVQNGTVLSLICVNPPCRPDFNGDGFLNGDDFDLFVAAFEFGDPIADYNEDGFVSGDDYDLYVVDFEQGC